MNISVLYPTGFGSTKVEPDYEFESDIAKKLSIPSALFNYDEFLMGDKLRLFGNLDEIKGSIVIYRGWMMNPAEYQKLYDILEKSGIKLINSPAEYCNCHMFPYTYARLKDYTPKTLSFKEGDTIDWNRVRTEFDRFIVKDFVKSVKGFGFPEYLTNDMSDEKLDEHISKFKQLRGDLYTGGIVLKQYMELDKVNNHTHEFRAFYMNGQLLTVYHNSGNLEDEIMIDFFKTKEFSNLDSHFYTVDFARLKNGTYVVIETGDGQVSGLPTETEAEALYNSF